MKNLSQIIKLATRQLQDLQNSWQALASTAINQA
jgi:hypothetical protein